MYLVIGCYRLSNNNHCVSVLASLYPFWLIHLSGLLIKSGFVAVSTSQMYQVLVTGLEQKGVNQINHQSLGDEMPI